uniref:THAP-type domain-containing protein n=1 Tax=Maylandia zebra TaxID=106582 RepID=A0A3P9DGH0_9CICH
MVRTCCVVGCNVRSHDREGKKLDNGLSFHRFPSWRQREGSHVSDITKQRRQAWIAAVRRADIEFRAIPSFLLVCSRHFLSGKPAYEMDVTNPDWAPTLHMGHDDKPVSDSERHARRTQRKRKRAPIAGNPPPSKNILNLEVDVPAANVDSGDGSDSVTEAEGQTKDCVYSQQGRAEINRLLEENRLLRAQLQKTELNETFLKDNTEKVSYYTGLHCYAVLMSLFNTVKDFLPISKTLRGFQMLLLTLMRLRLDLPVQHLRHLFDVSHKTLSSVFTDTINVLYARLGALVHWPERHCLQATMPPQFTETFGNRVAIIVDCFEIRTESLKARAQTYSHYKGTHTIKYLIGITPHGAISFISRGWGGRASDKHITERCGILQRLLPGDVVLADRGFDIRDAVGMMCAEVKIPAFTKGYCQLDARDVEQTRATAHLRIHVERVIGSLRNTFKMLHTTMPIRLLLSCEAEDTTFLDKIVKVCCVFVNMCCSKPGPNDTCSC